MKCDLSQCRSDATFHFTHVVSRHAGRKEYMCDSHAGEFIADLESKKYVGSGIGKSKPGLVCVDLEVIAYHNGSEDEPVAAYLHEVGGVRRFATLMDACAWSGLAAQIEGFVGPTPLTHVAWFETVENLGGAIQEVILVDMVFGKFFKAQLGLRKDGREVAVDARASDAFTLALISNTPIFILEPLLGRIQLGMK